MRLFIAIRLSDEMKKELTALQNSWRSSGLSGTFTKEDNLHLTLAFIGEYDDENKVLEVMKRVPFSPFQLALDGTGAFGDLFFAGLRVPPSLYDYTKRLRGELSAAGVPFDGKRLAPHVTLLRRASRPLPENAPAPVRMRASSVCLMRSLAAQSGRIYVCAGSVNAVRENARRNS